MSATLNDFRQITVASSSIFMGTDTLNLFCAAQFSVSVIPLHKRAWKLFNINASGGYRNSEQDSLIGAITTPITKGGMFHFGLLCDSNLLSTIFGQALAAVIPTSAVKIVYPNSLSTVLTPADLLAANAQLGLNDLQKATLQTILAVLPAGNLIQFDLFNGLRNQQFLFSLPFGYFNNSGTLSLQSDPISFSSSFVAPPGFDYLVVFPFSGLTGYDGTIGPVGSSFGFYNNGEGFNLSSIMTFNMLPLSSEDFERIIPV